MRTIGPGALFLAAIVAVGALAVADLQITKASFREVGDRSEVFVRDERVVRAESVEVRPGELLLAHYEIPGASPWVFTSYDFYIVPGGGRYAFVAGGSTPAYFSIQDINISPCCSGGIVKFDRPRNETVPEAPWEVVPLERQADFTVLSQPELLDLVWVFEYRDDVVVPPNGSERRAFNTSVIWDMTRSPPMGLREPTAFGTPILAARPVTVFATEVAVLLAVVAAGWWVVRLRRAPLEEASPGTEGLLELHAAAGGFLSTVRDLLVAIAATGLLIVVHASVASERARRPAAAEAVLAARSQGFVGEPVLLLYPALAVVACYALWNVHMALARWRRRAAVPPLDL